MITERQLMNRHPRNISASLRRMTSPCRVNAWQDIDGNQRAIMTLKGVKRKHADKEI